MVTIGSVFGDAPHRRPVSDTPLDAWLKARGISRYQFARDLNVSPRTVSFWSNNQVLPDLVNAFRIAQATGGGVLPEMWMGTELAKFQNLHANADWEEAKAKRRGQNKRAYRRKVRQHG